MLKGPGDHHAKGDIMVVLVPHDYHIKGDPMVAMLKGLDCHTKVVLMVAVLT